MQIELSQDTEKRYRRLAKNTGRSIEEHMHEAAERYLIDLEEGPRDEALEDRLDSQLIQERLAAWEERGRPGITLEEYARTHLCSVYLEA